MPLSINQAERVATFPSADICTVVSSAFYDDEKNWELDEPGLQIFS